MKDCRTQAHTGRRARCNHYFRCLSTSNQSLHPSALLPTCQASRNTDLRCLPSGTQTNTQHMQFASQDRRSGFITNPESCFRHGTRITSDQMAHPMFRQVISAPTGIMQTSPPVMSAVGKLALLFLGPFSRLARLHRLLTGGKSVPPPLIWRDILHVIEGRCHRLLHAFTVLFASSRRHVWVDSVDRVCRLQQQKPRHLYM